MYATAGYNDAAEGRVTARSATSRRQPFTEVNMGALIDITGQRFGRLVALQKHGHNRSGITWLCRCDCGATAERSSAVLRKGLTRSCGCLRAELNGARTRTHSQTGTRLWITWRNMRHRAGHEKNYEHVTVCSEWSRFETFQKWALANGYRDDLTIDRIDNAKGYEPSNCRWATRLQQVRNSRKVKAIVRSDGKRYETVTDAAADINGSISHVAAVCRGERLTHKGYSWSYQEEGK